MSRLNVAALCVICAALVAASGNEGWGWFLCLAFFIAV